MILSLSFFFGKNPNNHPEHKTAGSFMTTHGSLRFLKTIGNWEFFDSVILI
jgi:hypothetical protein